jgi:hypothetical protein
MSRLAPVALVVMLLAGCASQSVPVPQPETAQSAGVGMELKVRVSGLATYRADGAFFVRSCTTDTRATCKERLTNSNYGKDGRLYLLNAEPGEYRAVAAAFRSGTPGDQSLYFAYFPSAMADASKVQVRPGQFVYAGSYRLSAFLGLCPDKAEPAQLKYAEMLEPGTPKCGFFKTLMHKLATGDYLFIGGTAYPVGTQTFHYRGASFEKSAEPTDASNFRNAARRDLSGAGWSIGD